MKKKLASLIITLATIVGCQVDDFCVDPVTPNLVIGFYANENPDIMKRVSSLYVWAEGRDTLYENISADSIIMPLDPAEDFTTYFLSSEDIVDQITISYDRKEVFVTRSCGFKYNFEEVSISDITYNWIIDTEVVNQTIIDETEHIKIYH